jgi:hypothetical protein
MEDAMTPPIHQLEKGTPVNSARKLQPPRPPRRLGLPYRRRLGPRSFRLRPSAGGKGTVPLFSKSSHNRLL